MLTDLIHPPHLEEGPPESPSPVARPSNLYPTKAERWEPSFRQRNFIKVNPAPSLADFDSRWLLLASSGRVVHLWKVDDKIGYVDRFQRDPNHWVWLDEETLSKLRPFTGTQKTDIQPDLELRD
jgi:hypothetical protein